MENRTQIAVLGLGYVGCVTAACFSKLGHTVIGVDPDEFKVGSVNDGAAPFYEPGLEELVKDSRAAGRLSATTSITDGLRDADIAMICVGTPSERNGNLSLSMLRSVSGQIGAVLPERTEATDRRGPEHRFSRDLRRRRDASLAGFAGNVL